MLVGKGTKIKRKWIHFNYLYFLKIDIFLDSTKVENDDLINNFEDVNQILETDLRYITICIQYS